MKFFSATFPLDRRRVVIVGGGDAASRKARLVYAEAVELAIVAADIDPAVAAEWQGRATLIRRDPVASDFEGAALVFVALDSAIEAEAAAGLARQAGAPVNVVDRPALSDFFTPAVIDRGAVQVAISTAGAAPVLAQRLRATIEAALPARLGALASFAEGFRPVVAAKIAPSRRRAFWERFFDGPVAARVLAGDGAGAARDMALDLDTPDTKQTGVVHIVGAGPGDPDLLTLRAHRLLQTADVILYDRLVGDGVLALARRDAVKLYVGKAKSAHAVPQEEIGRRLVAFAREGKTVVRLKGGDPFVFGRGGEELDAVRAAGVPVFVTPGITAALGCAASAGAALTHRDHAQAVTFVTGHGRDETDPDINWRALADLKHTLVVYMGVSRAEDIAARLIDAGRAAHTPVAVIENGTRDDEVIVRGELSGLGAMLRAHAIKGPALLIIGEVAALATERDLRALCTAKAAA